MTNKRATAGSRSGHAKIVSSAGWVLYIAVVSALFAYTMRSTPEHVDDPLLVTHVDKRLGVQFEYPTAWYLQSFNNLVGMATHTGFILSSKNHYFQYPNLGLSRATSQWDMRTVPRDAVVVEVAETVRFEIRCKKTKNFPPALEDAQKVGSGPSYGAPKRFYIPICRKGLNGFHVFVWEFPESSITEREAAVSVVESINGYSSSD